ncbi:hypothetical protein AKJ09_01250 [Labilithrix luteola]|uniref:Uncharacterized protein n=1 Tax=Labilithrix luteola TaxID=1391654 RepID=A0A0K1PME8_9BACT|nr:hypothetical protein AKJ09_01250 [Labilithrix luteola]
MMLRTALGQGVNATFAPKRLTRRVSKAIGLGANGRLSVDDGELPWL